MKILIVFGTRPEIIKLAPVYKELISRNINVDVFWSGQHTEMANGLIDLFGIKVDYFANTNQSYLSDKHSIVMDKVTNLIHLNHYDYIIVQGDTTTAAAAAMSGFLHKVPVAHVEAGLRTNNMYSPYPEEYNRRIIGLSSCLHFCPTEKSKENIDFEKLNGKVFITGNTIVDALLFVKEKIKEDYKPIEPLLLKIPNDKKVILATMHRRENIGNNIKNVLKALKTLSEDNDKTIILPVHLNPDVKRDVENVLNFSPNVILTQPLQYTDLIWLLNQSWCVISDSGGIQEEVPAFGIKVFITRDTTERPEILDDFGILVGSNTDLIVEKVREQTNDIEKVLIFGENPFGDGNASRYIVNHLEEDFKCRKEK